MGLFRKDEDLKTYVYSGAIRAGQAMRIFTMSAPFKKDSCSHLNGIILL